MKAILLALKFPAAAFMSLGSFFTQELQRFPHVFCWSWFLTSQLPYEPLDHLPAIRDDSSNSPFT
jgi:hypothetical protein